MKKFGTPTDGAPGSDTENVGLRALGAPRPVGRPLRRVVRVVGWIFGCGRARWVARDRECVAREVAGSESELVGRAADVGVAAARVVLVEVVPGVVPAVVLVVVVELVEVVGVVEVAVVVGVGTGAAAVVVDTAVDVVGLTTGVGDAEVEVETEVVGGVVAVVVVVGELVVVDVVELVVVVVVLVTVVVVGVVVVVVDDEHEFASVSSLRSSDPAAAPSWLLTAVSSSLWPVTPAGTVTPGIVVDSPVTRL